MANQSLKLATFSTLLVTFSFQSIAAGVHLNYVGNYKLAQSKEVWLDVKSDNVPLALVQSTEVAKPCNAYSRTFPKAFYQADDFLVCNKVCTKKDARATRDKLEQQNVYYWLTEFYALAKKRFDLSVDKKVKVLIDRDVKDPGTSKKMNNNAFFNPADGSLSFLPAKNNPLLKLLGAANLNRSGFDPSVVAHEAGHSLFHVLFPNAVNPEIDGFNEGFADYMANILLNDPKVGVVMLRGKALRDSSSYVDSSGAVKTYVPGQEVHDMGERFATGLWLSREKVKDTQEFDHLVISAVKDVASNPFATGHGFKEAFFKRIEHTYEPMLVKEMKAIWEIIVPGSDKKIKDTSFLTAKRPTTSFFGLKVENKFSQGAMRDLGVTDTILRFTFIKTEKTKDGYEAHLVSLNQDDQITPYWIVIDTDRKNALGAWRLDGSKADSTDAENLKTLVKSVLERDATLEGFVSQAQLIAQIFSGIGEGAFAYKVAVKHTHTDRQMVNGQQVEITKTKANLKRKLLGRVAGVPNITAAELKTTKRLDLPSNWPTYNDEAIIAVMLTLEDGTIVNTELEMVKY